MAEQTKTMLSVPKDLWKKVKSNASSRGITLQQWINEAINDHLLMVEHTEALEDKDLEDISKGLGDIKHGKRKKEITKRIKRYIGRKVEK